MTFLALSYVDNPKEEKVGKQKGTTFRSWINYFLVFNSDTIKKLQRSSIISKFQRKAFLERCYSGNTLSNSIVPFGFDGYTEAISFQAVELKKQYKEDGKRALSLGIAKGVGNDDCVVHFLNQNLED